MDIQDRSVVLIGAAGGIGSALAKELDAKGAKLTLVGRNEGTLDALIANLNSPALKVVCDLSNDAGRRACATRLAAQVPIDMVINAAGISRFGWLSDSDETETAQMLAVNLELPIEMTRLLLPVLDKSHGRIVNIGSTFGAIGYPGYSAYCASKFGLRGFSEALNRELSDTGLRVLYIAPRATRTCINSSQVERMNEALGNKVDSPELVARQICSAIARDARMVHLGNPEKILVRLNAVFSSLLGAALRRQLPTIKKFAMENN